MIFKTFDNGINKWTAKIGIFGKSFNELGTAVNNAFKEYIDNIDNFDEDVGLWESLKSNLFSKKDDNKDWIKNSLGEIISQENINSYIEELDLDSAKEKLQSIFDHKELVDSNQATWSEFFDGLKDGEQYLVDTIKNTDDLSKLTGEDLVQANQQAREAAIAHNAALKQQTLGAKAAKVGMQALATAGNMLAMWAITKGLELATKAIDNYVHRVENAREKLEETTSELESVESQIEDVNSQIDDLLAKDTITLTDENDLKRLKEENEQLKIRQAILEAQKAEYIKDLNEKIEEKYNKVFHAGTEVSTDEYGNQITLPSGEDYLKNRIAYAKELIGLNRELTEQEKLDFQSIRDYALEQGQYIMDLTEGYEVVTAEEKAQQKIWNDILADIAYFAENEAGTIPDITKRLKGKFAHGVSVDTTDLWAKEDREIAEWIESLSDDDKKIMLKCDIDDTSLDNLKQYLAENLKDEVQNLDVLSISDIFSFKDAENNATALSDLSDQLSSVESAYNTCLTAKAEYDEQGYLSVDTLQKVLSLGDEYLQYLFDEEGNVRLDTDAFQQLAQARINDMEAQALSNLAENIMQITDEATATEYLAQKQNALASSYTDVAANALLALSTVDGFADSEALQGAYNSFKTQYEQIKSLFANTRKGLFSTYTGKSASKSSAAKAVEDATKKTKDYIEAYMNFQKQSLESGRIDYNTYCSSVSNMLKSMFDEGRISAQDYFNYTQQRLEVEKSVYDQVISAVVNRLDQELDTYKQKQDAIEERYQSEIEYLDTIIEYYNEQKKALQDTNDEIDRQKKLEEALYNLHRAQTQRTHKVYMENTGYIYRADGDAMKDASDELRQAKLDIEIAKLDEAIANVEAQQKALENAMEEEKKALQEIIDRLESYKDQWQSVAKEYETAQAEMMAEQVLGADWEQQILDGRLDKLNEFRDNYISIQQALAAAAWESANAQIAAAKAAQADASGSTGSAPSIGRNSSKEKDNDKYEVIYEDGGIPVKSFDTKAEAEAYVKDMEDPDLPDDEPSYYVKKKFHTGLDKGYVGSDNADDKPLKTLQKAGKGKLLPGEDEELDILQHGELVLTKEQALHISDALMQRVMTPNITLPDYTCLNNNISKNVPMTPVVQNINLTLPNITNTSGYERLQRELRQMQIDALQLAHKR